MSTPISASPLTIPMSASARPLREDRIVVVGGGMTTHRLASRLRAGDPEGTWTLTVIGEEPEKPYDRVHLSNWFSHGTPEMLHLDTAVWDDPRITLVTGDPVTGIDAHDHVVTTAGGAVFRYDRLILATGSRPWKPPAEGRDLPGIFDYRTIADLAGLESFTAARSAELGRPLRGVVIGGGVLGLEAAAALQKLGVQATVVEFADRLMAVQLDQGGGVMLKKLIEDMGVGVLTGVSAQRFGAAPSGELGTIALSDDTVLDADVAIFSTGIRPRDDLAREAGLALGERGGVVIGPSCQTSDPDIWAIGECACADGICPGLIAPGNDMADVVVDRFLGGERTRQKIEEGTKLKAVGVDAASFGDVNAVSPGALEVSFIDPVGREYRKLVVSDDAKTLLGGVFVGDIGLYAQLRPLVGRALGADPSAVIAPEGGGLGDAELPDDAVVCSCNNVSAGTIRAAVSEHGCTSVAEVKALTTAGTVCGSCVPIVTKLMNAELKRAGVVVSSALCEHFAMSRPELFRVIKDEGLRTFTEVVAAHGTGRGCAVCRPTVASILCTLGRGGIMAGEQGSLQDTNDHVMANIQRNGTYSVIPRMPGGEVTAPQLLEFAQVAEDFGLYIRVTGSQRLGMFGARLDQLPEIWRRLVAVGFESGHAYGKSLRMVKTCVGRTWCRYGVQDSTSMAVMLEKRYRGLRSPHKMKIGVSGCARECAEARAKDVGVIATNKGWNLYVGGNGGAQPAHGQLLAEDLDSETLVRSIDRYLMLYIQEADRLQRTARWVEEREGGIEELRRVILEDSLGIGESLEQAMQEHVDTYVDEWAATLDDPEQLKKFVTFVNLPGVSDPDLAFAPERGQIRPAREGDPVSAQDPREARSLATTAAASREAEN